MFFEKFKIKKRFFLLTILFFVSGALFYSVVTFASNPPVVDFGVSSFFSQTSWDGGVGTNTSSQYSSASNMTFGTSGQISSTSSVSWYDPAWTYRREIIINPAKVSSTQTNFPVLVTGYGFDANFFSNISSSGLDLVFTDSDGTTILPREVVSVSSTASTLEVWVNIPTVSSTASTSFYVYYGNSGYSLSNSTSVWTNNLAVWHFEEDPSITTDGDCGGGTDNVCDSTSNGNHATSTGFSSSHTTTSPIGNAYYFGTSRLLNTAPNASVNNLGAHSISFWMSPESAFVSDNTHNILEKICNLEGWQMIYDNDGDVWNGSTEPTGVSRMISWDKDSSTDPYVISASGSITEDAWQYITFTWDEGFTGTSGKYYRNGVEMGYFLRTAGAAPNQDDSCAGITIGSRAAGSRFFHGGLDEIRITTSTLSSSYVATEYNNQSDPATFYTVSSTETFNMVTGTLESAIFDASASVTEWGTVRWTTSDESNTQVRVRTSNDSGMSGATAFSSCSSLSQDQDLSSNNCVTDGERYMQYQVITTYATATFQDITIQLFSTSSVSVAEDVGSVTISASLDEVGASDVTVPFTISGSATYSSDHDLVNGNITISAGNLTGATSVAIVDDSLAEGNETIILTMGTPTNGQQGSVSTYTVTITDDPTIVLTTSSISLAEGATTSLSLFLEASPTNPVTIDLTPGSGISLSTSSIYFTSANYSSAVPVTITATDDSIVNGDRLVDIAYAVSQSGGGSYASLTLATTTYAITDDEVAALTISTSTLSLTEGGSSVTHTIALAYAPTSSVTVTLSANSEISLSTTSIFFATSTFDAPVTITVSPVDDSFGEGTHQGVVSYSVSQTTGSGYEGLSVSDLIYAITDDETVGVTLTTSSLAVTEGATTATYTIALASAPTSTVTVSIASADSELTISNSSVTFNSSTFSTPVTITITAYDDSDYEGSHTGVITHTVSQSGGGAYDGYSVSNLTFLITDNDTETTNNNNNGVGTFINIIRQRFLAQKEADQKEQVAESCALEVGKSYKSVDNNAVYYITEDCTKRPFQNSDSFFTYFEDWSEVSIVGNDKLGELIEDVGFVPAGPKYDPKYGAIVKTVKDPKIYLLLGGKKYWITSEDVFNDLNYKWSWVEDVDSSLLDKYVIGEEITNTDRHPNYTLIKYEDSPSVYRLEPDSNDSGLQVKRYIPNEAVFTSLGFRFDRIVTIKDSEEYSDGADMVEL